MSQTGYPAFDATIQKTNHILGVRPAEEPGDAAASMSSRRAGDALRL